LPQWNPVERLLRPYDRYRRFIGEELEPVWSDAELAIVGVKSPRRLPRNLNRASGRVGERQLERVLARLDAGVRLPISSGKSGRTLARPIRTRILASFSREVVGDHRATS